MLEALLPGLCVGLTALGVGSSVGLLDAGLSAGCVEGPSVIGSRDGDLEGLALGLPVGC